ncbi:MAG TPA: 5-formyltetrahydrofolate cyclo-ligase [Desulfitobacteriaceae bacterium]|nr:5-formyltetrahydrofolate cyclo-ligase [Desulfitobacteriaceae bacterium]
MTGSDSGRREDKKILRQKVLAARASLGEPARAAKSLLIQQKVQALAEYQAAGTVMLFMNFRDEAETTGLAEDVLARGKRLVLPFCASGDIMIPALVQDLGGLVPGKWGIREPRREGLVKAEAAEIDFVLVPGAAFDLSGNRLGYGAGYYDRFLELLSPAVPRVAIAFACQLVPEVPVEAHDKKMSCLITEDEVYRF